MADGRRDHWDRIYTSTPSDGVSWYEPEASTSIDLITSLAGPAAGLIDVGAGASPLVRRLIDIGWRDLTVLDVSAAAVAEQADRLGDRAGEVTMIVEDVLDWVPDRTYRVWHDCAVFHFLIDDADQIRYATTAAVAVEEGGHAVIGVFADDGPSTCSGLPAARRARQPRTPDDQPTTVVRNSRRPRWPSASMTSSSSSGPDISGTSNSIVAT